MQHDPISITHLILCTAFLTYIAWRIRQHGTLTLFHVTCFCYTATSLAFYPFVAVDRWIIVNEQTIRRGFWMALVFVGFCTLADLLFYFPRPPPHSVHWRPSLQSVAVLVGAYLFGLAGFLRFLFFGAGAFRHVGEVFLQVRAGEGYYDAREQVAAALMGTTGGGVAWGTSSVYIIMPFVVTLSLFLYRRSRRKLYLALAWFSIAQALLTVSVFMERAPVLFAITFPVIAWFCAGYGQGRHQRRDWKRTRKMLAVGAGVFVALGLLVYSWTDVGAPPLLSLLNRIFVTPCITANYYLAVFPDVYPYRGWDKIFQMGATLGGADIGTRDIFSYVTLGLYTSNPNSGMLPTAYSGAGILGCAAITLVYLAIVIAIDRALRRRPGEFRLINIVVSLNGIAVLANAPLLAALYGGFGIPSLLLIIFLATVRRRLAGVAPRNGPVLANRPAAGAAIS